MSVGRFLQQAAAGAGGSAPISQFYDVVSGGNITEIIGTATSSDGNVAFCGHAGGNSGIVGLIDADGEKAWEVKLAAQVCYLYAVTFTADGNVVAVGTLQATGVVSVSQMFVTCHDASDGSVLWQNVYYNNTTYNSYARDIILDEDDNLLVPCGYGWASSNRRRAVLLSIDPSDGSLIGSEQRGLRISTKSMEFTGIWKNDDGSYYLSGVGQVVNTSNYAFRAELSSLSASEIDSTTYYIQETSNSNYNDTPPKIVRTSDGTNFLTYSSGRIASITDDWSTLNAAKSVRYSSATSYISNMKITSDDKILLSFRVVGKSPDWAGLTLIDQSVNKTLLGNDIDWNGHIQHNSSSNADFYGCAVDSQSENFVVVGVLDRTGASGGPLGLVLTQSLEDGGGYTSGKSLSNATGFTYYNDTQTTTMNSASQTISSASVSVLNFNPTTVDASSGITVTTNPNTHNINTW
jgi:hypothetical protein